MVGASAGSGWRLPELGGALAVGTQWQSRSWRTGLNDLDCHTWNCMLVPLCRLKGLLGRPGMDGTETKGSFSSPDLSLL